AGQYAGRGAGDERGRAIGHLVLDGRDRYAGLAGDVDRAQDLGERLIRRRVLDLDGSVEVLVLDVDQDEGGAGVGHREPPGSGTGARQQWLTLPHQPASPDRRTVSGI